MCNSPQSPSSPSGSSVSSTNQHQNYQTPKDFYSNQTQTNTLQQHFEQFTMVRIKFAVFICMCMSSTNTASAFCFEDIVGINYGSFKMLYL